jgi:hypothetical protein
MHHPLVQPPRKAISTRRSGIATKLRPSNPMPQGALCIEKCALKNVPLKGVFASLTGTNSNRILKIRDEDFTITNLTRLSSLQNGIDNHLQIVISTNDLNLYLGNKVNGVLGTPVDFSVTFLATKAPNFAHRHPMNPLVCEGIFHIF